MNTIIIINLQRMEKEKEREYYESACKKMLIEGILLNKTNLENAKKLSSKINFLRKKFEESMEV